MLSQQTNRNLKANSPSVSFEHLLRAGNFGAADRFISDHIAHTGNVASVKPMLNNALHVCCKLGHSDVAGWVVERLINLGFQPDVYVFNRLLAACSKSGDFQAAVAWWPYLVSLGAVPNNITYNTMIHAAAQAKDLRNVVHWMQQLLESGVQPCKVSFASVISAFAKSGQWQEAELWFYKMDELYLLPDTCIFNNLISACAKAGQFARAEFWLSRMESYHLYPDQKTYNTVINLCAKSGDLAKATSLYTKMQEAGNEPDVFTFGPILYACVMVADLEAAEGFIKEMEYKGIQPNLVCYNTVLHCCAVCGDAERAMFWYERLQDHGLQARKITYSYMLFACVMAGRKDLEEKVMLRMSLSGFPPNRRDFAKIMQITYTQSKHRHDIPRSDMNTDAVQHVADALDEDGYVVVADPSCGKIDSSREAWTFSQEASLLATSEDIVNDEEVAGHFNYLAEEKWLHNLPRKSNKIAAVKVEHVAEVPQSPGAQDTTCNESDSFTTSSTCFDPISSTDIGAMTIESTRGPDPSEIGCVPLAWLDRGVELEGTASSLLDAVA